MSHISDLCIVHSRLPSAWPPAHSLHPAPDTSPAYSPLSDSVHREHRRAILISHSRTQSLHSTTNTSSQWVRDVTDQLNSITSWLMQEHEEHHHHLPEITLPGFISWINTRHSSSRRISSHSLTLSDPPLHTQEHTLTAYICVCEHLHVEFCDQDRDRRG